MPCTFSTQIIEQTISFHGHYCPGLSIGIRAAELAIRELGNPTEIEMVAVTETDMCGVDAIQFLTSCTYGKGNLMHRDIGKMAFSFFDRKSGKGFRALLNPEIRADMDEEFGDLMRKTKNGTATKDNVQRMKELREILKKKFMKANLDQMFLIKAPEFELPKPARVLESQKCQSCGESVMESRTRRFDGKTLCIPCFTCVEQKL